jgi:MFS family permease
MTVSQRAVLWTTCLSHGLIHVFELSVPALLVLIQQEFGVGDLSMGEVVTLYGLLFGLGALPAGFLVDRLGSRILLVACLWGSSLSMLGMALSPNLLGFSICAAFMGLGLSIYHPAGTALITHAMPPTGRVFALHGMAGNTGVASATVIAGTLGALVGWRWALGLLAASGVLLGVRALGLPDTAGRFEPSGRPRSGGTWLDFVLLLIAASFMGMVYRGMTTFLPKFFALRYSPDATSGAAVGGALTTAALMVGLLGMYAAGRLADSGVRPAWVFLAGALFQAPFLVAIGFAGGPVLVPLAMGVAFFHFLTQPVGNQMVARFTPPELRGLGYGIYFFFTFGAGSLGALLSGWVSEKFDLSRAFPALAIVLVPAVIVSLLLALLGNRGEADSVPPDPQPTIL